MKNFIKYYYGLDVDCIINDKKKYIVECGQDKYIFKICSNLDSINNYHKLVKNEMDLGQFFRIIPNKWGNLVSYVNNIPYVLSKISILHDRKITLTDINSGLYLSKSLLYEISSPSWNDLWANKIDILEDWLYEKRERYSKYAAIFNYYIGFSENALQYLNEIESVNNSNSNVGLAIQHYRLSLNSSLYDYFDFTNVVFDNRIRDVSEYVKSCFLNNLCDYESILNYFCDNRFTKYELQLLYARLLLPTFFYDYIENLFENGEDKNFETFNSFINNYERHLIRFSHLLFNRYKILIPSWILKKT